VVSSSKRGKSRGKTKRAGAKRTSSRPGRRREPKRRTGVAIVQAIVEGTEKIIAEAGLKDLTTAKIAKVSGVSVGSIYQYFDTKESILGEIARRIERRGLQTFVRMMSEVHTESLVDVVRATVRCLAAPEVGDVGMRRLIRQHVPKSWIEESESDTDAKAEAMVEEFLEARRAERRAGDSKAMAFVITKAVEGVFEAAIKEDPSLIEDEAFLAEVEHLALAFITTAPAQKAA